MGWLESSCRASKDKTRQDKTRQDKPTFKTSRLSRQADCPCPKNKFHHSPRHTREPCNQGIMKQAHFWADISSRSLPNRRNFEPNFFMKSRNLPRFESSSGSSLLIFLSASSARLYLLAAWIVFSSLICRRLTCLHSFQVGFVLVKKGNDVTGNYIGWVHTLLTGVRHCSPGKTESI
jgi:hypothetical protein